MRLHLKNRGGFAETLSRDGCFILNLMSNYWMALLLVSFSVTLHAQESGSLSPRQKIVHVLNRLGFGPSPGDIEKIEKIGIESYMRQQLHPEEIDDSTVEHVLEQFDTLQMTNKELLADLHAETRRFIQKQKEQKEKAESEMKGDQTEMSPSPEKPVAEPDKSSPNAKLAMAASRISFRAVGELQEAKLIRAIFSDRQLQEVLVDFWSNHFNIDVKKQQCRVLKVTDDREVIRPHIFGKFRDLLEASARSPAMLYYLDNWQNSISVTLTPAQQKARDAAIDKRLGPGAAAAQGSSKKQGGLNENYGREIMELHTLGVDGGYTQQDVQEVARCFTGWTFDQATGEFRFAPRRHDHGAKTVLGHHIPPDGGIEDGETVLDILASHPSTARFISRKLCQRFVCDDPPSQLVEKVAGVFQQSNGDLREVVEAIITSPEFFSPQAYRSKIKSPFEFAVSAVRATNGLLVPPDKEIYAKARAAAEGAGTIGHGAERLSGAKRKSLNWSIFEMGEPLFAYTFPTGYSEISSKWVSTGALIERLNFALALTSQALSDVEISPESLVKEVDADQPTQVLNRLTDMLLQGEVSETTRQTLAKTLPDETGKIVDVRKLTALILGSPEFQRR